MVIIGGFWGKNHLLITWLLPYLYKKKPTRQRKFRDIKEFVINIKKYTGKRSSDFDT